MMWGYEWGWPMALWMGIGSILWIVALGLLIWALVHWLSRRAPVGGAPPMPPMQGPSALEILRQRYARGEIDATTYEQMRERLEASAPSASRVDSPGVFES